MKTFLETKAISGMVIDYQLEKYELKPPYQRNQVWGDEQKESLIDSILRGYDIPKVYFEDLSAKGSKFEVAVIDGQQRLSTIFDFIEDKFPLGEISEELEITSGELVGKTFSKLPSNHRNTINGFQVHTILVTNASEHEVRDLFQRLQNGVTLNPAEKRNATIGNLRDYVESLVKSHQVFKRITLSNKRFQHDDWCAHVCGLEINGGATDLSARALYKLYKDNVNFDEAGNTAKKIKRILSLLRDILKNKPPEMKIKWGFCDLYLCLSKLDNDFVIKGRESDFEKFFLNFEKDRLSSASNPSALITSGDTWDKDLYDYLDPFNRQGSKRENIEIRHDVYMRRIARDIPDLTPKSSKRNFSENERIVIWREANETCASCKTKINFDDMHADHIIPHSAGGQTNLKNAQCLCSRCNLSKGAS